VPFFPALRYKPSGNAATPEGARHAIEDYVRRRR
jgi:hypothetical protein